MRSSVKTSSEFPAWISSLSTITLRKPYKHPTFRPRRAMSDISSLSDSGDRTIDHKSGWPPSSNADSHPPKELSDDPLTTKNSKNGTGGSTAMSSDPNDAGGRGGFRFGLSGPKDSSTASPTVQKTGSLFDGGVSSNERGRGKTDLTGYRMNVPNMTATRPESHTGKTNVSWRERIEGWKRGEPCCDPCCRLCERCGCL